MQVRAIRLCDLAVHHRTSPLKPHINLLLPSLNRRLDCGLLRRESVGQVKFSFHYPIRIMFLDGELRCESPILKFARSCHDNVALVAVPALHDCDLVVNYCTAGFRDSKPGQQPRALSSPSPRRSASCISCGSRRDTFHSAPRGEWWARELAGFQHLASGVRSA